MCLFDLDDIVSIICLMVVVLSQKRGTLTSLMPISRNRSIWYSKSFAASYMAINSACAELVAGILWSLLFQLVGPHEYEMYPEVDFLMRYHLGSWTSSGQPNLNLQNRIVLLYHCTDFHRKQAPFSDSFSGNRLLFGAVSAAL